MFEKCSARRGDIIACLVLAIFVLLMYIITIGLYFHFTETVLPKGDPFTYTAGFFHLLDKAHNNYWMGLRHAFHDNWYWMMNLPIVILSPILIKQPFSLCLINFIMYYVATISFYRLGRYLNFNVSTACFFALFIWIYPIDYGFSTYASIPVLGLDAMFTALLYITIANVLVYLINPEALKNALIAGLSVGLAVWGRGNSIIVVGFVLFIPVVILAYSVLKSGSRNLKFNFLWFVLISLSMCLWFYGRMWRPLVEYYGIETHFVTRHVWNIHDAMPFILNIPGFLFYRNDHSLITTSLGILCHLLVLCSVYLVFRRNRNMEIKNLKILRILAVTGCFIYFGTEIINIILWTDPIVTVWNCLLIYQPMLVGLTLALIVIFSFCLLSWRENIRQYVTLGFMLMLLFYAFGFTVWQAPKPVPGEPSPTQVKALVPALRNWVQNGTLSVLWYECYNPAILDYYALQEDIPLMERYTNKYYNNIWLAVDYSEANRQRTQYEIRQHLKNATVIIIPASSGIYQDYARRGEPYAFYRWGGQIISDYFNSSDSPRFVVCAIIKDSAASLLVVQRKKEATCSPNMPLKLPYGPRVTDYQALYSKVPHF